MPSALRRKPLPKPSPQSDPRFRRVMEQLKTGAAKTKAHPPASRKAADAARASKGPPNERMATGKAKQVDKLKEAKEGKPEPASFLAMLRAEIAKAMPKNLGETENFDSAADGMKSGLKGNVSQQKDKSTKDVSGASKQAPAPAGEAKAAQPLAKDGTPQAPKVSASEGMPSPKSDADISLQDSKQDTDQQMKEAEVTPTQLQKANDPRFSAALEAKQQVARNADAGPAKYRAAEGSTLAAAASQASAKARVGAAAMVGVRAGGNTKVLTRQQEQKAKDEAARAKVTAGIEGIFAATKQRVDAKLAAIDVEVNAMFDSGTEAALAAMKSLVNGRIRDYKIRRYLSIPLLGLAAWVRDQFLNLPDEVNVFYEQGRALFQAQMDALVVRVANLVEQRLREAKAEVAKGKQQIQDFVNKQPKELQQFAKEAQSKVSAGFDELEQGIENKKSELASSLAQKYKEGFDKANEALKAIQDSNKGFVAAFAEKLGEVLKAIAEFKARLTAILRKGADTIKLIIADPMGFLGNLISAVKGGVSAFGANIWKHLKAGFMRWLLGNAPPGIAIPTDLSPGSIFKLVLGVLGITYERMRAKAVKLLGPTAVTVIETLVKYVKALIEGGPAKLWEEVKSDLSNIKEMVIGAFQDWLITTIIQKAIMKIVSLFNPAGAIIQAILAIVSIVQFVVEKAAQIMEFVESVVNSVHAIATGSIGGAVKRIETALGNAVPLLIGFLASLLGLGGVSKKIREFVMKVQAKVDAAIDKALKKIVAFVKKTIGKLLGKGKKKDERTPEQKLADLKAGVAKGTAVLRGKDASPRKLRKALSKIKEQYRLTELTVKRDDTKRAHIRGVVNPETEGEPTEFADIDKLLQAAPAEVRERLRKAVESAASYSDKAKELYTLALEQVSTSEIKVPTGATKEQIGQLEEDKQKEIARAEAKTFAAVDVGLPGNRQRAAISGWGAISRERYQLALSKNLLLFQHAPKIERYVKTRATELFDKGSYKPKPHDFDRVRIVEDNQTTVDEGTYYITHAEKQAFALALDRLDSELKAEQRAAEKVARKQGTPVTPQPVPAAKDDWRHLLTIGVSRPVCEQDCQPFFRAAAKLERVVITIGDTKRIWVFRPDGSVWFIKRPTK